MNEGTAPTPGKGEGDFELRRPEDAPEEAPGAGAPRDEVPGDEVPPGGIAASDARPDVPVAPPAVADLKPLHDPDPYSTPPYGEPGPWAPAPPVQHPAATPAQGTAMTPPVAAPVAPPHGVPGPAAPAAPAPAAAPVVPGLADAATGPVAQGLAAPASAAPGLTASASGPAVPAPAGPAAAPGVPGLAAPASAAPGLAGPPHTPAPAPVVPGPAAPAPAPAVPDPAASDHAAPAPAPVVPHRAQAGPEAALSAPAFAPAVPDPAQAVPGTAQPPPCEGPAPATVAAFPAPGPVPAPLPAQAAPAPPAPAPAPAPPPPPAPASAAPALAPAHDGTPTHSPASVSPDPWHRYDPWAGGAVGGAPSAAPLQQTGAAVLTEQQGRRRGRKILVVGTLIVALVSGGVGGVVGAYLERNGGVGQVELEQAGQEDAGRDADSVAGIAARALPSVVTLHVSGGSGEAGTGTGFVLDGRGHILTNNHVVEPAGEDGDITVTFHSGETAKAEVVGRDGGYDLAVVRVRGVSGLEPLPLGNSDSVQVGDPVVAIGAPFDLAGTVTSGIISAKERPITAGGEGGGASDVSYVDALQTDAPINPGNSGGPLLDARARVIGINSAIRSADGGGDPEGGQSGSIGLGFAIPINQGKRVAEELINTGRATHPVIGVTLDMDYTGDGARVGTNGSDGGAPVTPGGPGAKAGIKPGDVITEVDGQRIHSGEELIVKTRAHRPGDRLELTLRRDGAERTISLVLGSSAGD
ncbi:trypsin-like peptidase domain-containing protein [Streptomyces sp. NPDC052023]|uniref:S1C family serine protease n=1 Tax=Streptomyces sp. NPDC052023 TaxID=3365681 RepID=UPI0037D2BA30